MELRTREIAIEQGEGVVALALDVELHGVDRIHGGGRAVLDRFGGSERGGFGNRGGPQALKPPKAVEVGVERAGPRGERHFELRGRAVQVAQLAVDLLHFDDLHFVGGRFRREREERSNLSLAGGDPLLDVGQFRPRCQARDDVPRDRLGDLRLRGDVGDGDRRRRRRACREPPARPWRPPRNPAPPAGSSPHAVRSRAGTTRSAAKPSRRRSPEGLRRLMGRPTPGDAPRCTGRRGSTRSSGSPLARPSARPSRRAARGCPDGRP